MNLNQMCPLKQKEINLLNLKVFNVHGKQQFIFDLRTFVANSTLSQLHFWGGTFGQNLVGGGTQTFYTTGDDKGANSDNPKFLSSSLHGRREPLLQIVVQ